jgi:hypothetical protein
VGQGHASGHDIDIWINPHVGVGRQVQAGLAKQLGGSIEQTCILKTAVTDQQDTLAEGPSFLP